jgi:branched-chain amino acid transport system permease protein
MTIFLQMTINGLALASIYALVALGFTIIYQATNTVNFAHGSLLLMGGLVVALLHDDIGFWIALVIGVVITAIASVALALLLRTARQRDVATLAVMTIGFDILLLAEVSRRMGPDVYNLGDPWGGRVIELGDIVMAQTRLAALIVAGILIAILFIAIKFTRWGLAMRAVSMDAEAASLMGFSQRRVELSSWVIAGALAAVAAVFVAAFPSQGLTQTTGHVALAAFPAAVIGGLGNPVGALLGSVLIGMSGSAAVAYQSNLAFLGAGLPNIAPYVVMVVVLLFRPRGLLGVKEAERV